MSFSWTVFSWQDADMVVQYSTEIEQAMRRIFQSFDERTRRFYAAIEARKLGHGGIAYISELLRYDRKTIRRGLRELPDTTEPLPPGLARKKGADENPHCP